MSSSTWQQHFKDKLVGFEPPESGSWLLAAFLDGRLEEDEYLGWASQTDLVPLLNRQFFSDQQPQPELLTLRPVAWHAGLLPVAEWDGLVVVAGLERPAQLPPETIFVFCSHEAMGPWWEALRSQVESMGPPTAEESDHLDLGGGSSPEGLALTPNVSAPPLIDFSALSPSASPAAATSTIDFSSLSSSPSESPAPDVTSVMTSDLSIVRQLSAIVPMDGATTIAVLNPQGEESGEEDVISDETDREIVSTIENTKTSAALRAASPAASPAATPAAALGKEAPKISASTLSQKHALSTIMNERADFVQQVQQALQLMSSRLPQSMLLTMAENGAGFIPLLWTESFGKPVNTGRVNLGLPSLFNIVASTEKPYHGFVVANDINNAFFAHWTGGKLPEHVTLVPVFYRRRMVGALLGIGPADQFNMTTLRQAEKISQTLTRNLGGDVAEDAA